MNRAPDWTEDEFGILLADPTLSSMELSKELPRRSPGAIDAVRDGVHAFHQAKDAPTLSQMMREQLEKKVSALTCARCGERF